MARKRRRGRPVMSKGLAQRAVITVRMREDEREMIETAARNDDTPLSEWIRQKLLAQLPQRKMNGSTEGNGIEPSGGISTSLGM